MIYNVYASKLNSETSEPSIKLGNRKSGLKPVMEGRESSVGGCRENGRGGLTRP